MREEKRDNNQAEKPRVSVCVGGGGEGVRVDDVREEEEEVR